MTVETTLARKQFAGNGVTTEFTFPSRFLANGDLAVYLINTGGTPVLQAEATDYTLTGADDPNGGTVTMTVAPALGEKLVVINRPEITQLVDLVENDRLPVETTVERPLDRLTMISQYLSDKIGRALVLAEGDTEVDMTLPSAATLANKVLLFDASSRPIAGPSAADISAAQTYAETAETAATEAAASAVTAAAAAAALPVPANPGDDNKFLKASGGVYVLGSPVAGGDVVGPASSVRYSLPLYDDTTGKLLRAGVALGTTGYPLLSAGAGAAPAYSQLVTASYGDATITMAKLAQGGATTGQVLAWSGTAWTPTSLPSASGEVNTASNVGGGAGLWKDKSGVDLRFRSLVPGSVTLTRVGDVGSGRIATISGGTLAFVQNANDVTLNLTLTYTNEPADGGS